VQRFDAPAGVVCSFELVGEPVINNEFVTTFPARPNGDVIHLTMGRLVERLTNVETGESITLNISGPVQLTFHPDGTGTTELLGRSVVFLFPVNGGPSTFINSGRAVYSTGSHRTQWRPATRPGSPRLQQRGRRKQRLFVRHLCSSL
jgi:hypothetical protein